MTTPEESLQSDADKFFAGIWRAEKLIEALVGGGKATRWHAVKDESGNEISVGIVDCRPGKAAGERQPLVVTQYFGYDEEGEIRTGYAMRFQHETKFTTWTDARETAADISCHEISPGGDGIRPITVDFAHALELAELLEYAQPVLPPSGLERVVDRYMNVLGALGAAGVLGAPNSPAP